MKNRRCSRRTSGGEDATLREDEDVTLREGEDATLAEDGTLRAREDVFVNREVPA